MKPLFSSIAWGLCLFAAMAAEPPQAQSYAALRAWHEKGALKDYPWPKEHRIDLNGDGKAEVLLGVAGHSRGMDYRLFTEVAGAWKDISLQGIEASHLGVHLLATRHGAWRDFMTLQPDGRGGLNQFTYFWSGQGYIRSTVVTIPKAAIMEP